MIPQTHTSKVVFLLLIAAYIGVLFVETPLVFPDALRGIEAMNQFTKGGQWNVLSYPDTTGDFSYFLSWWTPGQWMIPYIFIALLGLNTAVGLGVVIFLVTSIALVGYYSFFRYIVESTKIVWFSMLLLITNQLFFWQYMVYTGGDLFVFALLPFYLLQTLKLGERFTIRGFVFLVALSLIGFFCKGTFLIFTFAALSTLLLKEWKRASKSILNYGLLVLGGLSVAAVCYFGFLVFGETPGGTLRTGIYEQIQNSFLGDIFYPISSVAGILSRFSIVIQKVEFHTGVALTILLIIPFFVTVWLFRCAMNQRNIRIIQLWWFTLIVVMIFVLLYLANRAVSYDMRHFSALAFLFVPFLVQEINKLQWRKLWLALIIAFAILDLGYLVLKINHHHNQFETYADIRILKNDARIVKAVHTHELTQHDLIVIEDYWGLIPYFSTPKICIQSKEGVWYVNSGMELVTHLDRFELNEDKYDRIIVLSRNEQTEWLPLKHRFNDLQKHGEWGMSVFKK